MSQPAIHKRGWEWKESDLTSSVMEPTGSLISGGHTEMESTENLRSPPSYETSTTWEDVIYLSPTKLRSFETG